MKHNEAIYGSLLSIDNVFGGIWRITKVIPILIKGV